MAFYRDCSGGRRRARSRSRLGRTAACLLAAACAHVRVTYVDDDEALQAAALAAQVAPGLARIEGEILAGWESAPDSAARVALLDRTRTELAEVLAAPQLAAARDYIEAGFDEIKAQLAMEWARPRFRMVAIGPATPSPPAVAARIRTVRQRAEQQDLLTYLCVTTQPVAAARFRLWPQSYPAAAEEVGTAGEVRVYRGLYAYRLVPPAGFRTIECDQRRDPTCARIDLMADSRQMLSCNLALGLCARREGTVGTSHIPTIQECPNSG